MEGLIGRKLGMTQVFDEHRHQVPVTVIEVGPCVVVQRKTAAADGYDAVQLGFGDQKEHRLTKAEAGAFKKNGIAVKGIVREMRLEAGEDPKVGDTLTAAVFEGATHVDVIGITKGQGFQGVVKRHGMHGGDAAHGHMSHRRVGAIGQRTSPGRVFIGKRMPGHMGNVRVTAQNLRVVQVRAEDNVILVHGSVPGAAGGIVLVKKALKKAAKVS